MKKSTGTKIMMAVGCIIGLWSISALIGGVMAAGGVTALVSQYMTAVGMTATFSTLVEYYTYIKGIEYLICVAFFAAFPVFYNYLTPPKQVPKTVTA